MFFGKSKTKNDSELILYVPGRWSILIITGFILIPVFFVFVSAASSFRAVVAGQIPYHDFVENLSVARSGLLILLPLLLIPVLWTAYVYSTKLIISPDGLTWIRGGVSTVHVSWGTVQKFQTYTFIGKGGFLSVEFKLKTKVTPKTKGFFARLMLGKATNIIPLTKYAYVPWAYTSKSHMDLILWGLTVQRDKFNMEKFKQTGVGAKLYQYAPHLFETTTKL